LLISGRLDPSFADDGRISDENLLRWKRTLLEEKYGSELSIRDIRREAVRNVNQVLVLDRYLRYLDERQLNLDFIQARNPKILENSWNLLKALHPFTVSHLQFKEWHSPYLFLEDCYISFQEEVEKNVDVPKFEKVSTGSRPKVFKTKASEISISDICFMKRKAWEEVRHKIFVSKVSLF
jgi:hypothetical protein